MESDKQPVKNSDPKHYSVWKYLWRNVVGGLVLLSLEYFVFRLYIPQDLYGSIRIGNINFYYWCLDFLVVNLLVSLLIIFMPAWQEPKSLKTASLAFGSCLLAMLLGIFLYYIEFSNTFNNDLVNILFMFLTPLSVLSLILSVIGVIWGNSDNRKGSLPNPKAGEAIRLSRIALVVSLVILVPDGLILFLDSLGPIG